jgi:hypothetical protein
MFQSNNEFEQIDDNSVLWRYQDISRYLDLLLKQQLFFCRADRFEDPFEGQFNRQGKEELVKHQAEKIARKKPQHAITEIKQEIENFTEKHIAQRSFVTINAWHYNTSENYAMWKIYARGTYGIAIQTTYERLKRCFDAGDKDIFIGKVSYYDAGSEPVPLGNTLLPFLRKRNIYSYENEVRCCHVISHEDKEFNWQAQDTNDGIFIDVDINTLIERIYISPYSPKWIRDIVAGINEKFSINKEIVHSTVFDSTDY